MEQELDARSNYDPTPAMFSDLQPLLRLTYERELATMQGTKNECLNEMKMARKWRAFLVSSAIACLKQQI